MASQRLLAMAAMAALTGLAASASDLPGLLRPVDSPSRTVKDLSGVWNFRTEGYPGQGQAEGWQNAPLASSGPVLAMPVPSSFQDITVNASLRDFVGTVWYDTAVIVPTLWKGETLRLWFGSAVYNATVFWNGVSVVSHEGGHLPFEADVTALAVYGGSNRITVQLNTTLSPSSIPPGSVTLNSVGRAIQNVQFDFFPYAGLHRPVKLYTTPAGVHVDDVTAVTSITEGAAPVATVAVDVVVSGAGNPSGVTVELLDADGVVAATNSTAAIDGSGLASVLLSLQDAKLWWPYLMSPTPGYLYTLQISATASDGSTDVYTLRYGLRTVSLTPTSLLINGVKAYMRGFGKHEDADVRGKGLDLPFVARDFNLLRWFGANSFRSSHYPYAEEILDFADANGIMMINESPAVGLEEQNFPLTLAHHLQVESEHVRRDKNRASTIYWSVANEPQSNYNISGPYFATVISHVKALDPSRPVMFVTCQDWSNDQAAKYADVIAINKYYSWYVQTGMLDTVVHDLTAEVNGWRAVYPTKPIMITEYGGDTMAGIHVNPSFVFSEDYQRDLYEQHFLAFDALRANGTLMSEMTWCFADFMTTQSINRVWGNKKGVLTRDRQPKAAAYTLQARYTALAQEDPFCPLDLPTLVKEGCTTGAASSAGRKAARISAHNW